MSAKVPTSTSSDASAAWSAIARDRGAEPRMQAGEPRGEQPVARQGHVDAREASISMAVRLPSTETTTPAARTVPPAGAEEQLAQPGRERVASAAVSAPGRGRGTTALVRT